MKNYNEDSDEGYFIEVDVQYLENLHKLFNYVLFLPERMKIKKFEKLVANLHDQEKYYYKMLYYKHQDNVHAIYIY